MIPLLFLLAIFGAGCLPPASTVSSPAVKIPPSLQREAKAVTVVATDFKIPWGIAFLPNGDLLITERPGVLRVVRNPVIREGQAEIVQSTKTILIQDVKQGGEGGLLGIALHPDFKSNSFLYLFFTMTKADGTNTNRVERYVFDGEQLTERTTIIENIPGAAYHDGGRLAFGPDGLLYITTGDATKSKFSQDKNSLAGKILRVKDDGTLPSDNPFGTAVYSYGHRNPQGLAWDDRGRLWATEHGRSGVSSGLDEINLIEKGKNYGWPVIQGEEKKEGMTPPVIQSGPDVTWAPSGIAFFDGRLFFAGLRGETLYEYRIADNTIVPHMYQEFGRLRAVELGPDGYLYITTSNTDGRGTPKEGDDKVLRIAAKQLQ